MNKAHFPVTTLGFGRRVGLWTQGCSIRCPGCVSRDTWATNESCAIEVSDLVKQLNPVAQADGVTISGGEPLDQAAVISEMLPRLRMRCGGDICFFGLPHEAIFDKFGLLSLKSTY